MVLRQRSDSADLGTHDSGTDTSQQDTAAAVVQWKLSLGPKILQYPKK
jgi:hypothetical protein